jgi:quercetin dioxygenase-like cupin family protein
MAEKRTSISETPTAKDLKAGDGWLQMDVKLLVTDSHLGSKYTTVGRTVFPPGGSSQHALHKHNNAEEIIIVLAGQGYSIIGEDKILVKPGDVCYIPPGVAHGFANESSNEPCEIIFIYGGAPSVEKSGYELVK